MYLVDTSVWIDYFCGSDLPHVALLDRLIDNPLAVGISDLIYLEILQGAKAPADFERWKLYFAGQRFYRFDEPAASHAAAAQIYQDCRKQGVTVRSMIDCLIAQCARENDLVLLHNDADFARMAKVAPKLKQKHFLKNLAST